MKNVPCNLCGNDQWRIRYPATLPSDKEEPDVRAFRCTSAGYGFHAQIVQCEVCGHVYANPVWEDAELLALYGAVEDATYVEERVGRRLTFAKHLQEFEKHTGVAHGRALLDVGAYIGVFVEVAREAGWNAYGVEPSSWAVQEAQRHNLPIMHGTLDTPEVAAMRFDAVTMWDVIEHVADPLGELRKAYGVLNPGGYIAVHTMDIESRMAKLLGERWPWLMAMHIHYFSQRTLAQMLVKAGFEVLWSGAQGRYIRLNYLSSRIGGLNRTAGALADRTFRTLGVAEKPIPINLGDLFTVYARKPLGS
jgi:hypothetical protein